MNKTMLGIGAVAILAAVLIASSNAGTHDLFAKKYGQSNAQSAAVSNDCPATTVTPVDVAGAQSAGAIESLGTMEISADTNCVGDNPQIQDSDGALLTSSPVAASDHQLESSVSVP